MNTQYPIVSKEEVIDLFHAISFWRCLSKKERGINPCHWYTTFDLASKIMGRLHIAPERRFDVLRDNRDFFKCLIKRTLVVPTTDIREWATILEAERQRHFAVRISDRELINGNRLDPRDLFALRKIFITARGMAAGHIVERAVARLITRGAYEKAWAEMTAHLIPGAAFAARNLRYAKWLDEEEK